MDRAPEKTILYIVVPCYNEEQLIRTTAEKLEEKLDRLTADRLVSMESKVLFVDDGSTDHSWQIIRSLCAENKRINGICLAHNRGHQTALLAGMMKAKEKADAVITIDADLQQDVEAIDRFLQEYGKGSDIVYGIRNDRSADTAFKKGTAGIYYSLMHLFGVNLIRDCADYRLLSKTALEALSEYKEVNLFLRGIVPDMGLDSSRVYFDVSPRESGSSKYTLRKMLALALRGITSYTTGPIHMVFLMGTVCLIISIFMILYVLIDWLRGNTVPGYSTILISIWLIGGMILFGLGIVGEYVGQNYMESKRRPRYYIKDQCMDGEKK